MKKTVTLGQIEHELANLFPGQKISNIVRFSAVDFTVNNEQMHKEICVLFRFKYSNTEYCWDLDANVIFANVTNLKFNVLDPGETENQSRCLESLEDNRKRLSRRVQGTFLSDFR